MKKSVGETALSLAERLSQIHSSMTRLTDKFGDERVTMECSNCHGA